MPLPLEEFRTRNKLLSPEYDFDDKTLATLQRMVLPQLKRMRESIEEIGEDVVKGLRGLPERRAELARMQYLNGDTDTLPGRTAPEGAVTAMAEIIRAFGDAGPEEVAAALVEAGYGSRHTSWEEGRASAAQDFLRPVVDGFRDATPNPHPATA